MSFDTLQQALQERREQHLYRNRRLVSSPQGAQLMVDGASFLSFCSNDYLGLANAPEVITVFKNAADTYGVGGGASHLVCGHNIEHHLLEEEMAVFLNRPKALLFSTGYMANLGVISALLGKQDAVFEDKWNHASLLDGGLLSGAHFQRFLHNDISSLEKKLARSSAVRKLIVVDGVFSMDGDLASLPELCHVAKKYNAWVMVDDAHGFGVMGKEGRGCVSHFNLTTDDVPIHMCTLGKGIGTFGAVVAGSEALVDTLVQLSRPYIYTTSLPPAIAAATRASLKIIQTQSWRREKLQALIKQFRQGAEQLNLPLMPSDTPIQPLLIGSSEKAMQVSKALEEKGILISAIRPPTVPKNTARLRITLSASHSEEQIDYLLEQLNSLRSWFVSE